MGEKNNIGLIEKNQIIEEIGKNTEERNLPDDALSFDAMGIEPWETHTEFDASQLTREVFRMGQNYEQDFYHDVGAGGVRALPKGIIRKMNTFLIKPLAEEQTDFNKACGSAANEMLNYVRKNEETAAGLKEQIEELKSELQKAQAEINRLKEKMEQKPI